MQNINKIIAKDETLSEIHYELSADVDIVVEQNASYDALILQTGQNLNLTVHLTGENAKCDVRVVYLSATDKNNGLNVKILHEHQKTYSSQKVRGLLAGRGKTVYDGMVRMNHNCILSEGYQNHQAVLLSDDASVQCTPFLEIYADDVKCSHGSAIGSFDEKQLFYLMTRGLSRAESRKLLMKGFLKDLAGDTFEKEIDNWINSHE